MAALETAGVIGSIGGVIVMIICITTFNWNVLVSGMIGLTIGFFLAFAGVIVVNGRANKKKRKKDF